VHRKRTLVTLPPPAAVGSARGVTQIIMVDSAGRDKDSVSSLTNGENFSATWLRSS
jgi:hypothetical protein